MDFLCSRDIQVSEEIVVGSRSITQGVQYKIIFSFTYVIIISTFPVKNTSVFDPIEGIDLKNFKERSYLYPHCFLPNVIACDTLKENTFVPSVPKPR